jgi:hypothetical protein
VLAGAAGGVEVGADCCAIAGTATAPAKRTAPKELASLFELIGFHFFNLIFPVFEF